jgi:hypothetical protein
MKTLYLLFVLLAAFPTAIYADVPYGKPSDLGDPSGPADTGFIWAMIIIGIILYVIFRDKKN